MSKAGEPTGPSDDASVPKSAYSAAGVDIDAQDEALDRIKAMVASTATEGVLSETGSFGGLFALGARTGSDPVLVASADGVGTKLMVAGMARDYSTVGRCLVNHCVNDILVQGAVPLFFLDYVGGGVLDPAAVAELVEGVTAGCRENGCALLGGETAEMPGFYQPGDYELVGFVVGLVQRGELLDGRRVVDGDVLVGLPSSGLHTNGYSLARNILFERLGLSLGDPIPGVDDGRSVGGHLLDVHKSYLKAIRPLLGGQSLHGMAHITGGGLVDNLPRVLPEGHRAWVDRSSWEVPAIFRALQEHGSVSDDEMFRVFNMGVGLVLYLARDGVEDALATLRAAGEQPWVLGSVRQGGDGVVLAESAEDGA